MKEIRIFMSDTITVTDQVVALGPALEQIEAARQNGQKVIASVLSMERNLERIIADFFFGAQSSKALNSYVEVRLSPDLRLLNG